MSKPKVGAKVYFTDKGAHTYTLLNGKAPANDGFLGEVVSIGAMNIVTVKSPDGETDNFIWRFSDGENDHFAWEVERES